jgi:hypothetical protein
MECLNRVYPNIIKHFRMANDIDEVFDAAGIRMNAHQQKLKRKFTKGAEDEDPNEKRHSAQ